MRQGEELLEPEVERKLAAMCTSDEERTSARAALSRYGTESYEREVERVRLAIIKLSDGALSELIRMADAAKRDYRDVLMWAEYPEEGRAIWAVAPNLSEQQKRELAALRARDRAQLEAWRRK